MGFLLFPFFVFLLIALYVAQKGNEAAGKPKNEPEKPFFGDDSKTGQAEKSTVSAKQTEGFEKHGEENLQILLTQFNDYIQSVKTLKSGHSGDNSTDDIIHPCHSDFKKDRLQNMKILHDAGILDDYEYAERLAKIKAAKKT